MRIVVDLTSLSYHLSGIERYALCVTKEMLKVDKKNEYVLLFRNAVFEDFKPYIDNNRIRAKVLFGNNKLLFFQFVIPFNLYRIKADRYMFFAFPNPLLFFNKNIYNTIHDMGRWDFPGRNKLSLFYFKTTEASALKKAKRVFTVSEFSKQRIHELMGIDNNHIIVTYNGISDSITESKVKIEDIRAEYNLPERYVMFLSTLQPRKNLKLLVEAFSEITDKVDYSLVLVGRKGWEIDELISQYGANDKIIITGFVKDEHISAIYRNALCFVFPTLYEGFGIPPIEALAMGTPVISSDCSCMPEVLRNQATYFKNNNKEDLQKLLLNLNSYEASMPRELDEFQKENYSYSHAALKILDCIGEKLE